MVQVLIYLFIQTFCNAVVVENYHDFCDRLSDQQERIVCYSETPRTQPYQTGLWVTGGLDYFARKYPFCKGILYYYETLPSVITGEYDNRNYPTPIPNGDAAKRVDSVSK